MKDQGSPASVRQPWRATPRLSTHRFNAGALWPDVALLLGSNDTCLPGSKRECVSQPASSLILLGKAAASRDSALARAVRLRGADQFSYTGPWPSPCFIRSKDLPADKRARAARSAMLGMANSNPQPPQGKRVVVTLNLPTLGQKCIRAGSEFCGKLCRDGLPTQKFVDPDLV